MDHDRELLKGNTPTLVLAVLRDGPLHGYAIAREIERRGDNALRCKEGTLYPALHALEREGLIRGEMRTEGGRERRVYVLTEAGTKALAARLQTWSRFAEAVDKIIAGDDDAEPQPRRRRGVLQPKLRPTG